MFNNAGTLDFGTSGRFQNGTGPQVGTMNMNAGTVFTGTGTWTVGLAGLNDTATINAPLTIPAGIALVQNAGTLTASAALTAPTVTITGGTQTLNAASTIGTLNLTGGVLAGTGNLSVTNMTWAPHLVGNRNTSVSGTLALNAGAR